MRGSTRKEAESATGRTGGIEALTSEQVQQSIAEMSGLHQDEQPSRNVAEDVSFAPASKRDDVYDDATVAAVRENGINALTGAEVAAPSESEDGAQAPAGQQPAGAQPAMTKEDAIKKILEDRKRTLSPFIKPKVDQALAQQVANQGGNNRGGIFGRPFGYQSGKNTPRTREMSLLRSSSVEKREKERQKEAFNMRDVGNHIYDKLIALPTLGFRDVAVGMDNIMAVRDQNSKMLEQLFEPFMEGDLGDISTWSEADMAKFVNEHEIYVATYKPPDNSGPDGQRRRLRVLTDQRRGVYIHPIMAALYTADYDGDDMNVSINPAMAEMVRDPMSFMVDFDGKIKLDMKWLPVSRIMGGYDNDKSKTSRDYVREVVLADIFPNKSIDDYEREIKAAIDSGTATRADDLLTPLIDKIVALSETAIEGEDEQKDAFADVFIAARKLADQYANPTGTTSPMSMGNMASTSDAIMSNICQAVYGSMRNLWLENAFATTSVQVPADLVPPPRNYDDRVIYALAEGLVRGVMPNNFQELRVMLNAFRGNVSDKNAPFRFSADIGKLFKMDPRLRIGEGAVKGIDLNTDELEIGHYEYNEKNSEYEFVVDLTSDEQMRLMFEWTVKFAQSERMAKEVKQAGRSEHYSMRLRAKVLEEVGYPDSVYKRVGTTFRRYDNFAQWLEAFVKSYTKNAAIINQANLTMLSNNEISGSSNRLVVSPLKTYRSYGVTTYRMTDLAEPLLSVYGANSVERIFRTLATKKYAGGDRSMAGHAIMDMRNYDKYWSGSANRAKTSKYGFSPFEKEFSRVDSAQPTVIDRKGKKQSVKRIKSLWISGKYLTYNLRSFAHSNRLTTMSDSKMREYRDLTLDTINMAKLNDEEVEFALLMSIADKATGTASAYNERVFGLIDKDGKQEDDGGKKRDMTSMEMQRDLLLGLRRLNQQGDGKMQPSTFYVGTGSRQTPEVVRKEMTRLARDLNKIGFTMRSGHQEGADQAFEHGARVKAEIYVPSSELSVPTKFKGSKLFALDKFDEKDSKGLRSLVKKQFRPRSNTDAGTYDAMTTSYLQMMGNKSGMKSAFVACWIPVDNKRHSTDHTIRMAQENDVPVYNAYEYIQRYGEKEGLERWTQDVLKAANRAQMRDLRSSDVQRDQMLWVDDIVQTLVESDPDLFQYFGMDTTAGFLNSKWGMEMYDAADDVERLGSIRTAMVFEYRLRYIEKLLNDIKDVDTSDPNALYEIMDSTNNIKFAIDELADSSEVWHGIIKELRAEASDDSTKSVFQMMREDKTLFQVAPDGTKYEWKTPENKNQKTPYRNTAYEALDLFWNNKKGPNLTTHKDLRSVIEDTKISREIKWKIITDVVRYWEQDVYLKSYEVGFQMEIGNDTAYALDASQRVAAMKTHKDFASAFTRWGKRSNELIKKDVEVASDQYRDQQGALLQTLKRLDSRPYELISIHDGMYADSILAVKDKTYAQTEKASQHPWTNAIYAAVSFQRNGRFINDITRTNDRLMGLTYVDSIDIQDIIHLLANPDATMTVYNIYGEMAYLTRSKLLSAALGRNITEGNISEADIWDFLEQEPMIASSVRQHHACVFSDTDGTGYVGATKNMRETIASATNNEADPIDHVKYLMRDHPVYAGIISMVSKSPKNVEGKMVGAVSRNERNRIIRIEDWFCCRMYEAASTIGNDSDADLVARNILAEMGVTESQLVEVLRPKYETFLTKLGLSQGPEDSPEEDASTIYDLAKNKVAEYIVDIRNSGMQLGISLNERRHGPMTVDEASGRTSLGGLGNIELGIDIITVTSFWDVIQELGGAKTGVSTGIEGAETYNFGDWAQHIRWRDKYADLEDVAERGDVDDKWDGAWTNIEMGDSTATISISDDGAPFIMYYDSLNEDESARDQLKIYWLDELDTLKKAVEARTSNELKEIVVAVPDTYTVHDRSTDSYGNPLSSLWMYMVSKRSNGAETFNLKWKKRGYDGTDSIIKMQGKHRTIDVIDEFGNVSGTRRVDFVVDFLDKYENIVRENGANGFNAARLALAMELQHENEDLGYKDLTLANYMGLADLMIFQDDEGHVYVRSLEMLFRAIKYRIGTRVDEMTEAELYSAVDQIVRDTSDTAVGKAMMAEVEAFNNVRPKSMSSSITGIRMTSSSWARNFDLLDELYRQDKVPEPMSPNELERRDNNLRYRNDSIKKIMERVSVVRNHRIIGHIDGVFSPDQHYEQPRWQIGPENLVIVGDGDIPSQKTLEETLDEAYRLGVTVLVSNRHLDKLPKKYWNDAIVCSEDGDALLPMFDMRLNGSEAYPYNGGMFAIQQVPHDSYTFMCEDSLNFYELGDSQYKPLRSFLKRIFMNHNGTQMMKSMDFFPNVYGDGSLDHHSMSVSIASTSDINRMIATKRCEIDYGLVPGSRGWSQHKSDVDKAIDRYFRRYNTDVNPSNGIVTGDCKPGDVVGWVKCDIIDQFTGKPTKVVFAPIIPFPLHGTKKNVPAKFRVSQFSIDTEEYVPGDRSLFKCNWENISSLEGMYAKFFDSSGGANKGIVDFAQALEEDVHAFGGFAIDMFCAKASTDSRKIGTDRRIKTMISLMAVARMRGYNFAESDAAFPNDPQFKERMLHDRVPTHIWKTVLKDNDIDFVENDSAYGKRMNAFLNYECRKILDNGGNPFDYLATRYTGLDGVVVNTSVMWEFEAMFDLSLAYEDDLLKFLHLMDPDLCPNGLEDDRDDREAQNMVKPYIFRLARDPELGPNGESRIASGYDEGVLQMLVPYTFKGETRWVRNNVYVGRSFFGEDFSGFSRPNVEGSSLFLDAAMTEAYYGAQLDDERNRIRHKWATSNIGRIRDGGALGMVPPTAEVAPPPDDEDIV